jgi:predicted phage terminase large subunit-like protein
MTRQQAVDFLIKKPVKYAHMLGFTKLRDFHNIWIKEMIQSKDDKTLQGSRGIFKTTCVSVALALIIILLPNKRTLFMRKTDNDIKEVIKQVQKILQDPHTLYFVQVIYGVNLKLTVQSATEISTNLTTDIKGTSQLVGMGCGSSLTGKHFDYVFTDDIVNLKDRKSKAERDNTKLIYQELQNVKNRDGRIFNTGTPWHKDDAFTIMPNPEKWDCYREEVREVITAEELAEIKSKMLPSLFAANYELRHIASEDVIFTDPITGGDPAMCEQGMAHVDAAFGGEDYTAFTIMHKIQGKYYVFGKMWRKHVESCYDDIKKYYTQFMCGKMPIEDNGDKGFTARDLKKQGIRAYTYHESMNKHIKITTYLLRIWKDVIFVEGTDEEYINQICDYNEDAEHDDAPDSCSSLARLLINKDDKEYHSIYLGGGRHADL